MINEKFCRNIGPIFEKEQKKLEKATAGIVGMGGIGSPAFEILVRAGVGNFIIFDWDRFEYSNFNRQIYATEETIGKSKVGAAAEKAKQINKNVKIVAHEKMLDSENVGKLKGCNVVVDGTDNLPTRKIIAKFCRKNKIPYVFASAGGSMGMIGVFAGADFEKVFAHAKDVGCARKGIVGVAAILSGSIAAAQAVNVILGKDFVEAPEFLFFDVFSKKLFWKHKV